MALSSGNGGVGSSSSQNFKLAQDIHEEFLVCKICLEPYKTPKCLSCLHTFCEACIETHALSETAYKKYSDYRDFTCPLCRKRTQVPAGGVKKLPDNFLVTSLQDLVDRQRPASSYPFCDICRTLNRRHRDAQSKCIDCAKLLCRTCTDQHRETRVTRNHSIIDVDTEKDIECKEHKDELVRFYCMPCETAICILCTVSDHKEHEISSFPEAVARFKDDIAISLETCKTKLNQLEKRLNLLGITSTNVEETEQHIRDAAINFISEIRTREKALLEELHSLFGGSTAEELQKKKQELQTEVDGLRSTCSLAEIVLKGRDLELLMLKKQVQSKLKILATIDTRTMFLQHTIPRIDFLPGSVDLGMLQQVDPDNPTRKAESEDGESEISVKVETANAIANPILANSGRLSHGSMGEIPSQKSAALSPNGFTRSASFNFEVTSKDSHSELEKTINPLEPPGSTEQLNSSTSVNSCTQTTPVGRRERGITAILLPDQRAKACQVEPGDVEQAFAELNTSDEENRSEISWLPGHLFEEDEESAPVDQASQTDIIERIDVAVNTRCRVVQRQSASSAGGSNVPPSPSPLSLQNSATSTSSDYSTLAVNGSPGGENSVEQ